MYKALGYFNFPDGTRVEFDLPEQYEQFKAFDPEHKASSNGIVRVG